MLIRSNYEKLTQNVQLESSKTHATMEKIIHFPLSCFIFSAAEQLQRSHSKVWITKITISRTGNEKYCGSRSKLTDNSVVAGRNQSVTLWSVRGIANIMFWLTVQSGLTWHNSILCGQPPPHITSDSQLCGLARRLPGSIWAGNYFFVVCFCYDDGGGGVVAERGPYLQLVKVSIVLYTSLSIDLV